MQERHEPVWDGQEHKWRAGAREALRLALAEARLLGERADGFDAILVGYPGHADLPAARCAARGRPVVFNPLLSLVDTLVADRARFRPSSRAARLLRAVDRAAIRAADVVVADTEANARYLSSLAGVERDRVAVCLVGAEERIFRAGWAPRKPFTCLFVGKLIPLHGLETILGAAHAAPEVRFRVVGSGQLDRLMRAAPPNVEWVRWVPYESLVGEYHRAGCALGIFGRSDKASRVIPNKAFHALACGTPLVTADTPAARELLVDEESALLVPPGDEQALAAALRRLAADADVAARISAGGLRAYRQRASEAVLGACWRDVIENAVVRVSRS